MTMSVHNSGNVYRNIILLMMQAKRRLGVLCEERDMTPVQGMVLILFEDGTANSMNELSYRMGCDASNVTGLVDRLENSGLIDRTTDPADRRVKMITLSKKGRAMRAELLEGLRKLEAVDLGRLSPTEQQQFAILIDKLAAE